MAPSKIPKVCNHPGCDRIFYHSGHLNRHQLTHNKKKAYPCVKCGKSYSRSDNLRNHMKTCQPSPAVGVTPHPTVEQQAPDDSATNPRRQTQTSFRPISTTVASEIVSDPSLKEKTAFRFANVTWTMKFRSQGAHDRIQVISEAVRRMKTLN